MRVARLATVRRAASALQLVTLMPLPYSASSFKPGARGTMFIIMEDMLARPAWRIGAPKARAHNR